MKFVKDKFSGFRGKKAGIEYRIKPCKDQTLPEGVPGSYFVVMRGPGFIYYSDPDSGLTFPNLEKAASFCEELASGAYDWRRDVEAHRQKLEEERRQQENRDQEAAAAFIEKLEQQGLTPAVFLDLYQAFEDQSSSVQKYVYRQA